MVSDLDIWRAANLLIRKHGANAELEAAKRVDLMLAAPMMTGGSCGRGSGGLSYFVSDNARVTTSDNIAATAAAI